MKKLFFCALFSVLFLSCQKYKTYVTKPVVLRQMVKTEVSNKSASGSFLLVYGIYNSKEKTELMVRCLGNVDGMYRLIELPMKSVRIKINNNIITPTLQFVYYSNYELNINSLLSIGECPDPFSNYNFLYYIINIPEKYIPEKLIPITL